MSTADRAALALLIAAVAGSIVHLHRLRADRRKRLALRARVVAETKRP